MTPEKIIDIIRLTVYAAAEISAPMLLVLLAIGLTLSIFQSVTQITDSTLIFIPKLIGCGITLMLCFPWMLKIILRFTNTILVEQWNEVMTLALSS